MSIGAIQFVECSFERHGTSVLEILNEIILNSTAVYDYQPRALPSVEAWFHAKAERNDPCIGVEDAGGRLLGYATYGAFRSWPAYKYTVELSIHLAPEARGQGLGPRLLARLIDTAHDRGVHVMVAGIDASNTRSIAVHERLGFRLAGTVRECGFKFGRWLDLALYQRTLSSPAHPVDG